MRSQTYLKSIAICAAIVLLGSDYAVAGTWTPIDYPGSGSTVLTGISGNNIVGYYTTAADYYNISFFYNGSSWTSLTYPGSDHTWAQGISGNNIVGTYRYTSGNDRGFIYTVPEPVTFLLLGLGAVMLRRKRS